jgi:hypothetical protein
MAENINYWDGSQWSEVPTLNISDGTSEATAYRYDGSSFVQIYPTGTVIDSYEDQSMSEYSFASSAGGVKSGQHSFVTTSSYVTDGSYCVLLGDDTNDIGDEISFISGTGSGPSFAQGGTLEVDFTIPDISQGSAHVYYGSQGHVDSSTPRGYGYQLQIRTRDDSTDDIRLVVKDNSGANSVVDSASYAWGSEFDDSTLTAKVNWSSNDEHTCSVLDSTGSTIVSFGPTVDSTWTAETGVGIGKSSKIDSSGLPRFDYMRKS